jgi:hypothetical protein
MDREPRGLRIWTQSARLEVTIITLWFVSPDCSERLVLIADPERVLFITRTVKRRRYADER